MFGALRREGPSIPIEPAIITMPETPDIRILSVEHGKFPAAASFNHKIDPESTILKIALEIHWDDPGASETLGRVETGLRDLSDTFAHHQCRGLKEYRVFRRRPGNDGNAKRRRGLPDQGHPAGFDPSLALAHLIEHAIIDFQSYISGVKRCSGVTGALIDEPGRFDLLVECPDPLAGRCALALAVTWLSEIASGVALSEAERDLLAASRAVLRCAERQRTASSVAGRLGWTEGRAESALTSLCEMGCLGREPFAFNFSNLARYIPLGT